MIIELSKRFSEYEASDWVPYHEAIENLIQAHGRGWHIFAPASNICESIVKNCQLSRTQSDVLSVYVQQRFSTLIGQAKQADLTILAVDNAYTGGKERHNQLIVPLRLFSNPLSVQPFRLLSENSDSDGQYLKFVCQICSRYLGYSVPLNIELVHGGGSTTAQVLHAAWNETRPLICVVDGDQRYPGAGLGSTAQAIKNIGQMNSLGTVVAFILNAREMENLVPISFLLKVYSDNNEVLEKISKIHDFINHRDFRVSDFNVLDYIDLKQGICYRDIACIPPEIREIFITFCKHVSEIQDDDEAYHDSTNCSVIFSGISTHLLRRTIEYLNQRPRHEAEFTKKLISAPFWNSFEPIIRKILSFSASSDRLAVRI